MDANKGSNKIMLKCGFKLEGCQRKYWFKNGKYSDNILLGILRGNWSCIKNNKTEFYLRIGYEFDHPENN